MNVQVEHRRPISPRPLHLRRPEMAANQVDLSAPSRLHVRYALGSPPRGMETTMRTTTTGPNPALEPTRLYMGDGGRVFCGALRCAGMAAHFTGRTIAGQRVRLLTGHDRVVWLREIGRAPTCEGCGQEMGA
jgi:hypothetical protein